MDRTETRVTVPEGNDLVVTLHDGKSYTLSADYLALLVARRQEVQPGEQIRVSDGKKAKWSEIGSSLTGEPLDDFDPADFKKLKQA